MRDNSLNSSYFHNKNIETTINNPAIINKKLFFPVDDKGNVAIYIFLCFILIFYNYIRNTFKLFKNTF